MKTTHQDLVVTARMTGIWYLLLAITGMVGFIVFHSQVYVTDNAATTLENLTSKESTARIRLLLELGIIISQALAAVWFYKLFKGINEWAAWTLGIWGMMNAAIIMVSGLAMGAALDVATSTQSLETKLLLVQMFTLIISNAWAVGSVFFGLWLIPMGYIIVSSGRLPRALGFILLTGGVGYLLSIFLNYGGYSGSFAGYVVLPATVGELWIVLYLLIFGIRPEQQDASRK